MQQHSGNKYFAQQHRKRYDKRVEKQVALSVMRVLEEVKT